MMSKYVKLYALVIITSVGILSSILSIEQTSGQMINPNRMMNPGMMLNGTGVNPMFDQTQNITGSIKLAPTLFNAISPVIKVSLSDAIKTAETQLGNNSHVVAANLGHESGYLTYTVYAIDKELNLHKLIVDAGNGKILLTTVLPMQKFMLNHMMGPMTNPGFMGHMR